MNRFLPHFSILTALVGLAVFATPAQALRVAMPSLLQRVAPAEVVVVGKVTRIDEKGAFKIATVKIDKALIGAKGLTEIKVGFAAPQPGRPVRPGQRFGAQLQKDQEGCLLLRKDLKEDFYLLGNYFSFIDKNSGDFDKQVKEIEGYGKLLADPIKGLDSKSAPERFTTAALLVYRYRHNPGGTAKEVPIDAKENRLILQRLLEAEWPEQVRYDQPSPQNIFRLLNVTDKDGWKEPANFKEFPETAKKWLGDNVGKYRIKRWAADGKK